MVLIKKKKRLNLKKGKRDAIEELRINPRKRMRRRLTNQRKLNLIYEYENSMEDKKF